MMQYTRDWNLIDCDICGYKWIAIAFKGEGAVSVVRMVCTNAEKTKNIINDVLLLRSRLSV